MKRFLMFLVVTLVTISLGLTVYYFVYDDEVISFDLTPRYINAGTHLTLEDLAYTHKKPTDKTKIDFNAGGDSVTNLIEYDESTKSYLVKSGGKATIVIKTNHKTYNQFLIDVTIGDGTSENPFYISKESELAQIGDSKFGLDKDYMLLNDITLANAFVPIGFDKTSTSTGSDFGFSGNFNGNNYSISNVRISSQGVTLTEAGLFTTIHSKGSVTNLQVSDITVRGGFVNAGSIAGVSYGLIDKCTVKNAVVENSRYNKESNTYSGVVVGKLISENEANTAKIYRTSAQGSVTGYSCVGGLTGLSDKAVIRACMTDASIHLNISENSIENIVGGLVGKQEVTEGRGQTLESYSLSDITLTNDLYPFTRGALIGRLNGNNGTYAVMGLYWSSENETTSLMFGVGSLDYALHPYAAISKTNAELKTSNAYDFYQNSGGLVEKWSKNVCWLFQNGSFPQIMILNKPMPALPAEPNVGGVIITVDSKNVSSAADLKQIFVDNPTGRIKLIEDIDLKGAEWEPVEGFGGEFFSNYDAEEKKSNKIHNFKMSGSGANVAFFQNITNAYIHDIEFSNITMTTGGTRTAVVAANANGTSNNAVIENVRLTEISISSSSNYVGGLIAHASGYTIKNSGIYGSYISTSYENEASVTGSYYMGGCAAMISGGEIDGWESVSVNITGYNYVGGITGYNSTTLKNSFVLLSDDNFFEPTTEIKAYAAKGSKINTFLGGAAGYNTGLVNNVLIEASVNGAVVEEQITIYVGGVAGYNSGTIENSRINSGNGVVAKAKVGMVNLGGVVGFNSARAVVSNKCYSVVNLNYDEFDKIASNVGYQGGIVGVNEGYVSASYATGNIIGYMVGGLAGKNAGTITECYSSGDRLTFEGEPTENGAYDPSSVSDEGGVENSKMTRNELTGTYVAGLVAEMRMGRISDCYVASIIASVEPDNLIDFVNEIVNLKKKAGLVVQFSGNKNTHGIIENCISACKFTGSKMWNSLECPLYFMSENWVTGIITNCLLDTSVASNASIRQTGLWGWDVFGLSGNATGSNFKALSTAELTSEFHMFGNFSLNKWSLERGFYPKLQAFLN